MRTVLMTKEAIPGEPREQLTPDQKGAMKPEIHRGSAI
jgi:hypothetical protein